MAATICSNLVGRISVSTLLNPGLSTWKTPVTSPLDNKSKDFLRWSVPNLGSNGCQWGSSTRMFSRLYSTPCRCLINSAALRIIVSVESPRKSIFSKPIDSQMGNSNCVTAAAVTFFLSSSSPSSFFSSLFATERGGRMMGRYSVNGLSVTITAAA